MRGSLFNGFFKFNSILELGYCLDASSYKSFPTLVTTISSENSLLTDFSKPENSNLNVLLLDAISFSVLLLPVSTTSLAILARAVFSDCLTTVLHDVVSRIHDRAPTKNLIFFMPWLRYNLGNNILGIHILLEIIYEQLLDLDFQLIHRRSTI